MKYLNNGFVNVRTLRHLNPGDGLTLKNGRMVVYKTGYIVATHGVICHSAEEATRIIRSEEFKGNCGIWINPETGEWCIDHYRREYGKTNAHIVGGVWNQIAIFNCAKNECENVMSWPEIFGH